MSAAGGAASAETRGPLRTLKARSAAKITSAWESQRSAPLSWHGRASGCMHAWLGGCKTHSRRRSSHLGAQQRCGRPPPSPLRPCEKRDEENGMPCFTARRQEISPPAAAIMQAELLRRAPSAGGCEEPQPGAGEGLRPGHPHRRAPRRERPHDVVHAPPVPEEQPDPPRAPLLPGGEAPHCRRESVEGQRQVLLPLGHRGGGGGELRLHRPEGALRRGDGLRARLQLLRRGGPEAWRRGGRRPSAQFSTRSSTLLCRRSRLRPASRNKRREGGGNRSPGGRRGSGPPSPAAPRRGGRATRWPRAAFRGAPSRARGSRRRPPGCSPPGRRRRRGRRRCWRRRRGGRTGPGGAGGGARGRRRRGPRGGFGSR